jgi:hypothetical protein
LQRFAARPGYIHRIGELAEGRQSRPRPTQPQRRAVAKGGVDDARRDTGLVHERGYFLFS